MESEALMLYGSGDVNLVRRLIENVENPDQRRIEVHKLNSMVALSEALTCRRRVLLGYFGEEMQGTACGNCDICLDPPETYDGSKIGRMAVECVQELSGDYGVGYVVDVLRGSKNTRICENEHDKAKSHGAGVDINGDEWMSILRQLVHRGIFVQDISRRAALVATKKAELLLEGGSVTLAKYQPGIKRKLKRFTQGKDKKLYQKLVEMREKLAEDEDVAPYALLSDVALTEMSQLTDVSEAALQNISGMGQHKLEAYGEVFLETLKEHAEVRGRGSGKDASGVPKLLTKGQPANDAQMHTWGLYKKGANATEIAAQLGTVEKNVYNHYIALVRAGYHINVPAVIGEEFDEVMTELDDADPYASLTEVKRDLSVDLTNEFFRLILAWREAIGVA
jgi:ATP-dependent DNA helicase RecQ